MATGGVSADSSLYRVCPVCLNTYSELQIPKLLPCHHTFCLPCLVYMGQQFPCPTCRRPVTIPAQGPCALQTNFYIRDMQEADTQPVDMGVTKIKAVNVLRSSGCVKHQQQPLCFYCRWCTEAICRDCLVLDHCQTEGHDVVNIHEVFQEEKQALMIHMNKVTQAIQSRQENMQRLKREMTHMTTTKEETVASIDSCFDEFLDVIQHRRQFLKDAVMTVYRQKSEKLNEAIEEIATNMKCLESANEVCADLVMADDLSELITVKESLLPQTAQLLQHNYDNLSVGAYLQFNNITGMRTFQMAIDNLGKVEFGKALPSKVILLDAVLTAGLKTPLSFQVLDSRNKSLSMYPISVIVTDSYGDIMKSKVKSSGGSYRLTFTPQISGIHKAKFHFLGVEFETHELLVRGNNPVFTFGEKGSGPGKFKYPFCIEMDHEGNIYVGDSGNCRIQKFTPAGQFLEEIKINPTLGTLDEDHNNPDNGHYPLSVFDMAVNHKNQLIVSLGDSIDDEDESEEDGSESDEALSISSSDSEDDNNPSHLDNSAAMSQRSETTTSQGTNSSSSSQLTRSPSTDRYGSLGRRRNRFRSHGNSDSVQYDLDIKRGPKDTKLIEETVYFAVNSKNQYITSAFQEETVNVYNRHGQFIFNIATSSTVSTPQKVCIGLNDEIIVVDAGHHRIKIYNNAGTLLKQFGHKGNGKGKFHEIHGIAIDHSSGHLVVSDEANKRLQVFTRDGELTAVIESNADPIKCPTGICLTDDGHVLVVDTTGHRILKFKFR